ncbi:MAG: Ig-like domain-containing protein [Bdellovibrionales bacterium]|nr:Ig-like domain-containing protein [Bdellovibrionales bacterium]
MGFTLKLDGSKVTLTPKEYLNWESTYTLTVNKSVVSTKGYKLEKAPTVSFTTEVMPEPKIDWVDPIGSQASVLKPVIFKPNFDVIEDSLEGNVSLFKVNLDGTKTNVEGTVSFDEDSNEVSFIPNALEYSTNYQLVIKGGSDGIQGILRPAVVYLAKDHESSFQTLAPGVISNFPENGNTGVPNEDLIVELELNFFPTTQSVNSSTVQIIDTETESVVSSTYTVDINYIYVFPQTLKYNHKYRVVMTPDVQSDTGTKMAQNYQFEFTTWKRQVLSFTPSDGAISEILRPTISVEFNFDVDPSSIGSSSFQVSTSRNELSGFQSIQGAYGFPNARTVTFTPSQPAEYFTFFHVVLNTNIKELNTNQPMGKTEDFKFRTLNRDLSVVSTSPAQGADEVSIDNIISASFNLPLENNISFLSSPVEVYESCTGQYLDGSISISDNKVFFVPELFFASGCKYTVTLSKDIIGLNNEQQTTVSEYSWSFSTDSLKPLNFAADYIGSSDVTHVTTSIEIDFNHSLVSSSFRSNDVSITEADEYYSSSKDFDYYINGSKLIITPYGLDYGTRYTITVKDSANLKGLDGVELTSDYSFTFKTEPIPVIVTDYSPTGNYTYVDEDIYVYFNLYTYEDGFPDYKTYFSSYDDDTQVKIEVDSKWFGYVPSFSDYASSNYIRLSHSSDFDYDETYEVDITIYYPDLDGTIYEYDYYAFDFTTELEPVVDEFSATSKNTFSLNHSPCDKKVAFCRAKGPQVKALSKKKSKPVVTSSEEPQEPKKAPMKRVILDN